MNVLGKGFIDLVDHMGNDDSVVSAARVSRIGVSKYVGKDKITKDQQLIKYMMEEGHTSPFEHVVFTFIVKCPLFVARQWMRHRTWSYNEISRRYTSENIDFYTPDRLRLQDKTDKQSSSGEFVYSRNLIEEMKLMTEKSYDLYLEMIENNVAREQARMILPQNMFTEFYATVNLHNLFHFLKLRRSPHSQLEIRVYATAIEQIIFPIVPLSYVAWTDKMGGGY